MFFLAPLLLPALALAAGPIIIHLLNRRRFQIVDWAPMKYLKLTIKTNRRRLRIEQLILLAVRTLAIIFLILAIARPVLSQTGMGAWLGKRSRTARIMVLDDSLSMGYVVERRSAFDSAKDAAGQIIKTIGAQDSLTVLTTSALDAPLLRDAQMDDPGKAQGIVGALAVTDTPSNWPAAFKAVDGYLASATFPTREVIVVTDFRRSGWTDGVKEIANRWAAQSVAVRIVDVGSHQTQNIALAALEQEDAIALPGEAVSLTARIRNDSGSVLPAAQAQLKIGDESRPLILPDLPPGKTTDVPLSVTPAKAGQVPVHLKLPGDSLPQDDQRFFSLSVRPSLEIALVDGETSVRAFESATDFLATAFSVGASPWHLQRSSDSEWQSARPQPADVLVLANVASIAPEQLAQVERMVQGGMGLMIFAGEQIDPVLYNQRLYKDGAGLLPCRIDKVAEGLVTGLVIEPAAQSPLAPLNRLAPAALTRIVARRFMSVTLPEQRSQDVRVLARWNDPAGSPAVIEKRVGRGSVLLWTITADRKWSDWPVDPTYVLAVRSAAVAIARGERQQDNLSAGQPIQLPLGESQSATDVKIIVPGVDGAVAAAVIKPEKGPPILRYDRAVRSGAYTLSWKDVAGADQSHLFCVSPDKSESDLEPITDAQLSDLLGSLHPSIIHYAGSKTLFDQQGKEIWRTLATILLALVAVETVLAVWVGRER